MPKPKKPESPREEFEKENWSCDKCGMAFGWFVPKPTPEMDDEFSEILELPKNKKNWEDAEPFCSNDGCEWHYFEDGENTDILCDDCLFKIISQRMIVPSEIVKHALLVGGGKQYIEDRKEIMKLKSQLADKDKAMRRLASQFVYKNELCPDRWGGVHRKKIFDSHSGKADYLWEPCLYETKKEAIQSIIDWAEKGDD